MDENRIAKLKEQQAAGKKRPTAKEQMAAAKVASAERQTKVARALADIERKKKAKDARDAEGAAGPDANANGHVSDGKITDAPPAETPQAAAAEEVIPDVMPNFPIKDMEPALLDKMTFLLANNDKKTKVRLAIGFKPGTDFDDIEDIQAALESKIWPTGSNTDANGRKGYGPEGIDKQGHPVTEEADAFILRDEAAVASLIKELFDAGRASSVRKKADFVPSPTFELALETKGVNFKGSNGAAKG